MTCVLLLFAAPALAQDTSSPNAADDAELAALRARVDALESREEAEGTSSDDAPTVRPLASFRTRVELREGYGAAGVRGTGCVPFDHSCIRFRARLGLETSRLRVAEGVAARLRFSPQAYGSWTDGSVHPAVGLFEGYLALHFAEDATLEVGRFVMSYGDQQVIGGADWGPAGRSFDGLRLRLGRTEGDVGVDVFWTMQLDALTDHVARDSYFYGIYVTLGSVVGGAFDLYGLVTQRHDTVEPDSGAPMPFEVRGTIGGRFLRRIDAVDFAIRAGLQAGMRGAAAIVAGQAEGEVGVNVLSDGLRIAFRGTYASGDDPSTSQDEAYDHLFPTGHAMLGLTDVIGARRNVLAAAMLWSVVALPQLTLALDLHAFLRPRGEVDPFVGYEVDAQAIWRPGGGLRLRALYAIHEPLGRVSGDALVHFAELEIAYQLE